MFDGHAFYVTNLLKRISSKRCNKPFSGFFFWGGGTCGPSPENPNVVHFVDSKSSDRDVTEHN